MITLSQYFDLCADTPDDQRHGQWAFNMLFYERPDLANQLHNGPLDPFYSDAVLPEFYRWVEANWQT